MTVAVTRLEHNILSFAGIRPNRHTLIGIVEWMTDAKWKAGLETSQELGQRAR